jgi:outer membrane protein assembly factor BamB
MSRSRFASLNAVPLLLLLVPMFLQAQDSPQWRGPNRDGVIPSYTSPQTWPEQLKQKWQVNVGIGYSSPLLVGKNIFTFTRQGEQEVVSCLDLDTGRVFWRNSYAAPYTVNPVARTHGSGPKSTPAFSSGRLFTLGIGGILSAWDAQSGKLLWRREFSSDFKATSPDFGTATSPIVDGKLVITCVGGNSSGALMAFDVESGKTVWKWAGDGPAYASPIIVEIAGTRQVVTQSQEKIIGVSEADGKLLWSIPFRTPYVQNIITPIFFNGLLIFSGLDQGVGAMRVTPSGQTWKTENVWENQSVSFYMSDPVINGGLLFGMSHKNKGQFVALNAASGRSLWESKGRVGDNTAILTGGDKLFLLTSDAELIVAEVSAVSFQEIRRYKVAKSTTYAHPVIAGKNILVKDAESLALWGID